VGHERSAISGVQEQSMNTRRLLVHDARTDRTVTCFRRAVVPFSGQSAFHSKWGLTLNSELKGPLSANVLIVDNAVEGIPQLASLRRHGRHAAERCSIQDVDDSPARLSKR
jgi:hypothetical protein